MRLFCALTIAVIGVLVLGGCESQQSASGLDDGIQQPAPRAQAAPRDRILPVYTEEGDEDGPLEFLFGWMGGDDANQAPRVTRGQVLGNLSPELSTRTETPDDVDIAISKTLDHDGRGAWDDIQKHLLLDRPTRLSMEPTP